MRVQRQCHGCAVLAVICGVAVLASTFTAVDALEPSKPKGVIYGSLGLPSGPDVFSDRATLGFGGGLGLAMQMVPRVGVQLSVEYTTFGADENGLRRVYGQAEDVGVIGGEISLLYAAATVRVDVVRLPAIQAYVSGGAGFFRYAPDQVQFDNVIYKRETENTGGFHGGIGVDVPVGSLINVFADATYVVGATEGESTAYLPLRLGLIFELTAE